MRLSLAPFLGGLLLLGNCGNALAQTTSSGFVSAIAFRQAYPEPTHLGWARDAFLWANRLLVERSARGGSADVSLLYPDGTVGYGRDEFFSGAPVRFHELRQGNESIAVGQRACTRTPGRPWECSEANTWVGLRPIHWEAVTSWSYQQFTCPHGPCQVFRVRQADTMDFGDGLQVSESPERDYYEFSIFVDASGLPLMTTEGRYQGGVLVEPLASFVYRFDRPIAPIRLPD